MVSYWLIFADHGQSGTSYRSNNENVGLNIYLWEISFFNTREKSYRIWIFDKSRIIVIRQIWLIFSFYIWNLSGILWSAVHRNQWTASTNEEERTVRVSLDLDTMCPPWLPIYWDCSKSFFLLDHFYSCKGLLTPSKDDRWMASHGCLNFYSGIISNIF